MKRTLTLFTIIFCSSGENCSDIKNEDVKYQDKILFTKFSIIPFYEEFCRSQCYEKNQKIPTSRKYPTRPLDSRKKYDHKKFKEYIARNFIESDSNTETKTQSGSKLDDVSPIPSQNDKILNDLEVNDQKSYLTRTEKRTSTDEYDFEKNKKMTLHNSFPTEPELIPITEIIFQTNNSSSQPSKRHGSVLKPNLKNRKRQYYNVQDMSNLERFVQPFKSEQKKNRIDEIHKKIFEINIIETKKIITEIDMFINQQNDLNISFLNTISFFYNVEQKILTQYCERNKIIDTKFSDLDIDTDINISKNKLLNNYEKESNSLANIPKSSDNLKPDKNFSK